MANLGVPIKLLHESLGHIITVELKTGESYRGKLMEGESRSAERGAEGCRLIESLFVDLLLTLVFIRCLDSLISSNDSHM